MKKFKLLFAALLFSIITIAQNVAINDNGAAPDASAMLDVQSTTKGFLPPRVYNFTNIISPATGLLVFLGDDYSSYTPGYYYNSGTSVSPVWTKIGSASDATQWTTSGSEIYYNSGNVGIGTTSPGAKLDVQASGSGSTGGIRLRGFTTSADVSYWSEGQFAMMYNGVYTNVISSSGDSFFNGGDVGIGTTSPSYKLHVNGSVAGNGAYNALSDSRLKKDVVSIDNGLEKVMQLRPITFNWKQEEYPDMNFDDRNHVGFIAQEVVEVVPQVVTTADDEMQTKSIAYSDLVPVLTKAIQEQQQEIESLKKELSELKKMIQLKK